MSNSDLVKLANKLTRVNGDNKDFCYHNSYGFNCKTELGDWEDFKVNFDPEATLDVTKTVALGFSADSDGNEIVIGINWEIHGLTIGFYFKKGRVYARDLYH